MPPSASPLPSPRRLRVDAEVEVEVDGADGQLEGSGLETTVAVEDDGGSGSQKKVAITNVVILQNTILSQL